MWESWSSKVHVVCCVDDDAMKIHMKRPLMLGVVSATVIACGSHRPPSASVARRDGATGVPVDSASVERLCVEPTRVRAGLAACV